MTDLLALGIVTVVGNVVIAAISNKNIVGKVKNVVNPVKEKVETILDKQDVIHKQIDGQQDKLLALTKKVGIDEGKDIGRAEVLDEQNPETDTKPK